MTRGTVDPESIDLGGSEVPSTPIPPPPNPRASSTSLPNVVTLTPNEELIALADYCRPDGGIVDVFKRMRRRTHGLERALQATNAFVAQIKGDLGELPNALREDSGSGALLMLAKQARKLTEIENGVVDIRDELRADREARKKAAEAADKAAKDAKDAADKSPAARVKWIAISAFVGAVVVSTVAGVTAYITMHWNPNPVPAAAPSGH